MAATLRDHVERAFGGRVDAHRMGVEVEMFWLGPASDGCPLTSRVRRRGRPSREPGGQLELSPAPASSVDELLATVRPLIADVERSAAGAGASIAHTGTRPDPRPVALVTPTPRYLALQEVLDRAGPDGRRMMRQTAGLQVCVDLLPGEAGREQWLVANLAGPALAAAFANSPHLDGRRNGRPGNRTRIWSGVDLTRTGHDGRHLDPGDPVGAYDAFARSAVRLPLTDAEDPAYHLGTLYPPVRPRGRYLEVRYLDAQPVSRIGVVVETVRRLLLVPAVRRAALELLLPRLGDQLVRWHEAAEGRSEDASDLLQIVGSPEPALAVPA